MGLAEEEVLIRDDSGLLLDTSEVRIPKSQAWTKKLTRTICLSLGFLVLGLCVAIPGPTLLDLEDQVKAVTSQMMIVFASRSLGYLLGALLGGMLFDCFDKQLLLFCTLLISSVATVVIPWSLTLVVMATMFALQGITMGVLDTGGNIYCIQLWGKKNGPFIQTLHFAFGIGAFVAPLLARPFLSSGTHIHNTTEIVRGNIPVAPFLHEHHAQNMTRRSLLDMFEELDEFHRDVPNDIDFSHKHASRFSKRDSSRKNLPLIHLAHFDENYFHTDDSVIHSIAKRQILGKISNSDKQSEDVSSSSDKGLTSDDKEIKATDSSNVETSTSINNTNETDVNITDGIKQVNNSGVNVNSVTSSSVAPANITMTSTPSTTVEETVKKPSAATDNNRVGSSADGQPFIKHLNDHKNDVGPEVVPKSTTPEDTGSKDVVNGTDQDNNANITNNAQKFETAATNSSNITVTDSTAPTSQKQDLEIPQTVGKVMTTKSAGSTNGPAVSTVKPDDDITASTNNDKRKPNAVSSSSPSSTTNSTTTTTTTTAKPSSTTTKASTTKSTTTKSTTTKSTTTTTKPTTTTTKSTTTTTKPTTTTITKTTTIKPTTKQVTAPDNIKTSKNPPTTDKAVPSKISTVQPSSTGEAVTVMVKSTSSVVKTTNGSAINNTSVQSVTEIVLKPETTVDSFLNHAITAVKNISRIQIAYGIIGLLLFLIAIVFLVLYCRDRRRISVSSDFDEHERYRSIDSCTKSTLIILLGFFFFCYMGLEVTFGALVTTFTVEYNHWPKEQGAVVAAIFWGSLATGRGLSIFISRCCGPTFMLAFDMVVMIIGGLVLAVGVPYFDKLLWLGTLILGLGMSSAFPAGITWAETKFHLSGKSTAVFVIGSAIGQMGIPLLSGYLYEKYGAMSLMYITVVLTVVTLLIFIIMQFVAFRSGGNLKVNARNGFLPLEDDEDDENMEMGDLVHFDKSQTRTLRDRRSGGDAKYHTLISDLEDD